MSSILDKVIKTLEIILKDIELLRWHRWSIHNFICCEVGLNTFLAFNGGLIELNKMLSCVTFV